MTMEMVDWALEQELPPAPKLQLVQLARLANASGQGSTRGSIDSLIVNGGFLTQLSTNLAGETSFTLAVTANGKAPGGFLEFYQAYPRKIARSAAEVAYAKAIRKASPADIMRGLLRAKRSWEGKDPQYIPHPATWLNQGRWQDESSPAKSKKPDINDVMR